MTPQIVLRPAGSGGMCASILAELPEWFGLPQSNANYARLADENPAWIALANGEAAAIMLLKPHFDTAVEIELLAVRPRLHHAGIGRALVGRADAFAAERGAAYLTVKTRGPSKPYEPYERTRAFYQAVGFVALEEFTELWDAENPALLMVRPVRP
jgi:ribosomal protein S18 acetylase RimI-like enzyme